MKGKAMLESAAYLETASGSKYLVQLCKHFAHKITVSYSETHGECQFSCGTSLLDADEKGLRLVAKSNDEEGLAQTQHVIESHLLRFTFREELQPLDWRRQDASQTAT
jgi:hypothetical protein